MNTSHLPLTFFASLELTKEEEEFLLSWTSLISTTQKAFGPLASKEAALTAFVDALDAVDKTRITQVLTVWFELSGDY